MRPSRPDTWMWARAQQMLEEAARIQRHYFTLVRTARIPSWSPPFDMFEQGGELRVFVALPGVDAERVEVQLDESTLRVGAPRSLPVELRGARLLHMEIPLGYFERSIPLPARGLQIVRWSLRDGLLELALAHGAGGAG